jgi:hypothetical protein
MRAKEFIPESKKQMEPSFKASIRNASTFPKMNISGSSYVSYRFGLAMAGAPDFPTKAEGENWIGGDPLLAPYSEEENAIIDAAAAQVGGGARKTHSNNRSLETADVNKTSTIAKIKKNRYGV